MKERKSTPLPVSGSGEWDEFLRSLLAPYTPLPNRSQKKRRRLARQKDRAQRRRHSSK